MDTILCPECHASNPIEASVCEQCNAHLAPVKSIVGTANNHYNQALALAHQGKLDEALGQLEAALALNANQSQFYNLMGTLYAQKGLYSEAIRAWEKCLALDPEMDKAFQNIDRARHMEEERAEEDEKRPAMINTLTAGALAAIFLVCTLFLGYKSFSLSRYSHQLALDISAQKEKTALADAQYQALNSMIPEEGIEGVLKKLIETDTVISERDRRIRVLEDQSNKSKEQHLQRIQVVRGQLKIARAENVTLKNQLKQIDQLKQIIVQNETQTEALEKTVQDLNQSLSITQKQLEQQKQKIIAEQKKAQDLTRGNEEETQNLQSNFTKTLQEYRATILQLRDEVAAWERTMADKTYADSLVVEAVQFLEKNEFHTAQQNLAMALKRSPDHAVALFLQDETERILNDVLEQEVRFQERADRQRKREVHKTEAIARNLKESLDFFRTGEYNQAIEKAQRVQSLEPKDRKILEQCQKIINQSEEKNRQITMLLLEAQNKISSKDFNLASSALARILKQSPRHAEAVQLQQEIKRLKEHPQPSEKTVQ